MVVRLFCLTLSAAALAYAVLDKGGRTAIGWNASLLVFGIASAIYFLNRKFASYPFLLWAILLPPAYVALQLVPLPLPLLRLLSPAKASLLDRGIGVMLIMRGPRMPAGRTHDELVSHLDLLAKRDLAAFRQTLDSLPGPLGATTSVEECAEAFVRGIEKRASRINVPGWVGLLRVLKPLLSSRLFELVSRRDAKRTVPLMDEEVARLGRSASARVTVPSADREESAEAVESAG